MPDPQKSSKAEDVAKGFASVAALSRKAAEANKKTADKANETPEAPPIDTGSVGGFISSAAKRLKYAVYGPDEKK